MKKGMLFETVGLSILAMSLASCGGGIDPTPDWTIDVNANKSDITLNTYFPASSKSNEYFQNSYIPQQLEKITGYKVNYNQTSEGGADTQVQALLTGKDNVDMLKIGGTLFNNYVTSGYFTDLTDGIKKYAPNLESLSKITKEQWDACSYDGKIYAIPEVGHTTMVNVGLVWNMDHLKKVGITETPDTISEFDAAIKKLQEEFGKNNANYHALGIAGTMSEANPITSAFDMPKNFYVNDKGELENMLFSDRTEAYLEYMNSLAKINAIASGWSGQVESTVMSNFVNEYSSVMVSSYWNVTPLRKSIIASYKSFPDNVATEKQKTQYVYGTEDHEYGEAAPDALIQWEVFLKGDGQFGTNYQEKGKTRDSWGIAYYITVPVANAKRAAYTLDWVNLKQTEESTILTVAGTEGLHYEKATKDDKDAVKLLTEEGEPEEYVKVLDKFYEDISGNSQYQTAVNPTVARKWWPVAEKGFDAWEVLVTDPDQLILDPFAVHPVLKEFAKVDLLAQNFVVTSLQNVINKGTSQLEAARKNYTSRFWKDSVKNEVNTWFKNK